MQNVFVSPLSTLFKLLTCTEITLLSVLPMLTANAAEPEKNDIVKIEVTADRKDALYKCGDEVIFQATVSKGEKPMADGKVTVRISNDGMKTISSQEIDLAKNNPFKINGTMSVPGFLRCDVTMDKVGGSASAGFEPEKIQAANPMPEDFRKFWDDGIRELDNIPPDVKIEPLPKFSTSLYDCFKVSLANIDNTRIYGFLSVPKDKKGPFPALVSVHGAGHGFYAPDTNWVKNGVIVLFMNVHQYDPPTDIAEIKKVYDELNKQGFYSSQGAPDRNKYYFRKSILGINRAINWLAERPDVDKEHIAIYGSSQGGAFTLIMSGLNKNIKAAAANVPAMCDQGAYRLERNPGWPRMVAGNNTETLKMSGYFDTVNFARYITCPVIMSVGFIDSSCSPSSVYAAYNVMKSPKQMFNEPAMGHSQSKRFSEYQFEWLKGKLGLTTE